MKNHTHYLYPMGILLFSLLSYACGGPFPLEATDSISPTTTSFSPTAGATGVSLTATVTVTFSEAMLASSFTTSTLKLTASGSTTNLCTSVSYDSSSKTATCAHATLAADKLHTITVTTGAKDSYGNGFSSDSASSFTTVSSVSSMSNTSVTATSASNNITATFNFGAAVPSGFTPTVTAVDQSSSVFGASNCAFNATRTAYSCTINGVSGCTFYNDITTTLSGTGFVTFSAIFNTTDDEFDNFDTTSSTCFDGDADSDADYTRTNNTTATTLAISVPNTGSTPTTTGILKDINLSNDVAVATKITAETETNPSVCGSSGQGGGTVLRFHSQDGVGAAVEYGLNKGDKRIGSVTSDWLLSLRVDTDGDTEEIDLAYATSGSLLGTINQSYPYYFCITRRSGILRAYISTDGATYLPMSASELTYVLNQEEHTLAQLVALDSSGAPTTNPNYELDFDNSCANSTYTVTLDYMRFRSSFSGSASASDCPRF